MMEEKADVSLREEAGDGGSALLSWPGGSARLLHSASHHRLCTTMGNSWEMVTTSACSLACWHEDRRLVGGHTG